MTGLTPRLNPDTLEEFQLLEQLQPGFCKRLLRRFEESFEQGLTALAQHQETEAEILHRLSGSAASFGAVGLAEQIRQFERQIQQGHAGPNDQDISQLEDSVQAVRQAFQSWLTDRCDRSTSPREP
ncbi:MAG: Hpt domain-containing protein [Wenzhouxiangella sp.]